ncbi:MAG: class I SAM-dependent methyltransferase [Clostridium sp.]|nr:class I SAM-dependent methyltransferase [Clostridium sp.]
MIKYLKESENKKTMSYNIFAAYYDRLTENVDYKVRSDYISNFFSKYKRSCRNVLDLACGTGSITECLTDKGYNVLGIDLSNDMLSIASEKCPDVGFICADMTNFKLHKKVDACICGLDSINHLKSIEDVGKCFSCVADCLNDGGLFIFDVNTEFKHENILADNTFVFDEDDFFLSWDNEYLGDGAVRILLDFFVFNGKSYDRFSEEFTEKAYSVRELKSKLASFEIIGIYDELTENEPKEDSERIYFVCKKVK